MHVSGDVPDVPDVVDVAADVGDSSFWYWRRLVVQVAPRFFSLSSDDNDPFGWMPNPSIKVIRHATDRKHNRHDVVVVVVVVVDDDILDIITLVVVGTTSY